MNARRMFPAAAVLVLAAAMAGCQNGLMNFGGPPLDMAGAAAGNSSLATFVKALEAADMVDTLKGEKPLTVFAPNNEAFAKLAPGMLDNLLKPENKQTLQEILKNHIVDGKLLASEIKGQASWPTELGKDLTVRVADDAVMVNNATVVDTLESANGVIHVVDEVINPD